MIFLICLKLHFLDDLKSKIHFKPLKIDPQEGTSPCFDTDVSAGGPMPSDYYDGPI